MNFKYPLPTDFEQKQRILSYSDDEFDDHLKRVKRNAYKLYAFGVILAIMAVLSAYAVNQLGLRIDGKMPWWLDVLVAFYLIEVIASMVYDHKTRVFTSLESIDPRIEKGGVFETLKKVCIHSEWAQAWRDHVRHDLKRELYFIDAKLMLALANNERSMKWRTLAYGDKAKPYRSLNRDSYVGPGRNDNVDDLLGRLNRLLY